MEKGDMMYLARITPETGRFEVVDLKIRSIYEKYFVGTDQKSSQAFLFSPNDIGEIIFSRREDAVDTVNEAQEEYQPKKFTIDKNDED